MAGVAIVTAHAGTQVATARLVFFALGDKPVLASAAAHALIGHPLDDLAIDRAVAALARDLDPPADLNGASATKRHLAQVVLRRALTSIATDTARSAA
jgi:aerobic carbon-monoxide dehydrogenase medium subunit